MTRPEIKAILKRHHGAQSEIARSFVGANGKPIDPVNVTQVLAGKSDNARLLAACEAKAKQLLEEEGHVNGPSVRASIAGIRKTSAQGE